MRTELGRARIVDQPVDPSPALDRSGGEGTAVVVVGDIRLLDQGLDPQCLAGCLSRLCAGPVAGVINGDMRTAFRALPRAGGPDT